MDVQKTTSEGSVKTHDEKTRRQGTTENDIAIERGTEADFARTKLSKPACDKFRKSLRCQHQMESVQGYI